MKKTFILFSVLLAITACKKDINACKHTEEITESSAHKVDLNTVSPRELLDTLSKYPRLQLERFDVNTSGWYASCNVFYKGLRVFSDKYRLNKSSLTNVLVAYDTTVLKPVEDISVVPSVSIEEAVKQAKRYVNLDHTCIQAQLGCYNQGIYASPRRYILVWKIQGDGGTPYAIINAGNNGLVTYYGSYTGPYID